MRPKTGRRRVVDDDGVGGHKRARVVARASGEEDRRRRRPPRAVDAGAARARGVLIDGRDGRDRGARRRPARDDQRGAGAPVAWSGGRVYESHLEPIQERGKQAARPGVVAAVVVPTGARLVSTK